VAELMLTALAQTGDRDAALARFAESVSGAEAEVLRDALTRLDEQHGKLAGLTACANAMHDLPLRKMPEEVILASQRREIR